MKSCHPLFCQLCSQQISLKALFLDDFHLPFIHSVRKWTTVSTSSVSVFTLFWSCSRSLFVFVSMSHSVQSVQEGKREYCWLRCLIVRTLTYTVFTCRVGRNKCSATTHTHTHHTTQYTHIISKMYHSNCVNSNITLRPCTSPPLPFLSWPWCNYQST